MADPGDAGTASDEAWDEHARDETPIERLDRNWADLLQELRVVQTGVQFLTGFLLTLPFQARFASLAPEQVDAYLATVAVSVAATGFLIAPVSLHRVLFRRHERRVTVRYAHHLALIGVCLLALAIVGVVWLIFDVVRGGRAGLLFGSATAILLLLLWAVLPWTLRCRSSR